MEKLTEKEQAFLDQVKAQVTELVEKGKAKDYTSEIEEVKALAEKAANKEDMDAVKKALTDLDLAVKSVKEIPKADTRKKAFGEQLFDAYKGLLDSGKLGNKKPNGEFEVTLGKNSFEKVEIKSATTITEGNITPSVSNAIPFTIGDVIPGLTTIARRNPFIIQLCNVGRTIKKYVQWVEQQNPDGGAGTTSEGSAKTEQDFDLVEKSAAVQKITSYIKVSKEMLDDVEFMRNEINNSLMELVLLKLDTQVLLGDGSAPNLNGIITQAATFAATPFVNGVDYANRFDVLRAAINQIVRSSGGDSNYSANFVPNYIVLHPDDVTAMELTKNTQGSYLLPPFMGENGKMIGGCQVVANTGMTSGQFLVGDFTKANVFMREDASIAVGYENDDFTKNLVTILCETRAVCFIKSNHTKAFSYGVFSSAITSMKDAKS